MLFFCLVNENQLCSILQNFTNQLGGLLNKSLSLMLVAIAST